VSKPAVLINRINTSRTTHSQVHNTTLSAFGKPLAECPMKQGSGHSPGALMHKLLESLKAIMAYHAKFNKKANDG